MGNQLQVCCTDGGNDNSNNQMDYNDEKVIDKKRTKTIIRNKTKKRENMRPAQSSNQAAVKMMNDQKNIMNRSNSMDLGMKKPQDNISSRGLKKDLAQEVEEQKQANIVHQQIENLQGKPALSDQLAIPDQEIVKGRLDAAIQESNLMVGQNEPDEDQQS